MKIKTLLILLFFCSFQNTHLFSMENNWNTLNTLVLSEDNNLQQAQKIIADAVKSKEGTSDAEKNFKAISVMLRECKSNKADELFVYMESLYKVNSESHNSNPNDHHYKDIVLNNSDVPSSHSIFSNTLVKQLTLNDKNLETEKQLICNWVKEGEKSETAKKYYRALSLKLHPDRNPDNKNAEELFKHMNESYNGKHFPIISTQYEYDFKKIVSKKESINGKKSSVDREIESYTAPLYMQALSIYPVLQYKGTFFLTHKVINATYSMITNRICNKLFADISDSHMTQLQKDLSDATTYKNDLNQMINQEYRHTKMLVNRYLDRNN